MVQVMADEVLGMLTCCMERQLIETLPLYVKLVGQVISKVDELLMVPEGCLARIYLPLLRDGKEIKAEYTAVKAQQQQPEENFNSNLNLKYKDFALYFNTKHIESVMNGIPDVGRTCERITNTSFW